MWVTAACVDPTYRSPVIDSESDQSAPAPHHVVSGHFEGTDIRFNIYLPPANRWQGRFFQYTYPFTDEKATERTIGFALASGGYAVQAGNSTLSLGYRHAAAAAKFARTVAARYYSSGSRPIYGYLWGASGGSFQVTGAMENTSGVWAGFMPLVQGVPMSGPYTFFIRAGARFLLADKAEEIADAVRPGGSGDPYHGLDAAEAAMLHELTNFGVQLRAWENPDYLLGLSAPDGLLGFGSAIRQLDPTYVTDFWSKPGYLGTERSPLGGAVRAVLAKMGDTVDHRWDIALGFYYRHQVPPASDGYTGFDQFRAADGTPLYPQRAVLWGPALIGKAPSGGALFNGKVTGKVMVIDNLYDVDALPWHADWYSKKVKAALGDRAFQDSYRLYYNDHADHLDATGTRGTYLIDWFGSVEQGLRDLSAWAEDGVAPPASTTHTIIDQQVTVPANAAARRGLQPTVDLTVRGAASVHVAVGEPVPLKAKVQMPPHTGAVVATEWDCEGDATYITADFGAPKPVVQTGAVCRYDKPGTYYAALRVAGNRNGVRDAFAQVMDLDRVRVVVR
ncbi:hypothetical protein [Pedococcus sp. 5OH_020]|uniref:hypothetical protein n=1 Tax=Pedococcus sp. 5OH_020 TaxID=2989814 RepID=UPI0022E9E956|nr:hypothetical protein [Pedococcus sp. 5OH_020]